MEGINMDNYKCERCGSTTYGTAEHLGGEFIICEECGYIKMVKERDPELVKESLIPKCPSCGSTAITAGPLTYRWSTKRTMNRCANCGYSWEP